LLCLGGAIAALQYEIRLEGLGVFVGALAALIVCFSASRTTKAIYLAAFLVSAMAVSATLNAYFRASFERANRIVSAYGGTPAERGAEYYSTQWWALWSGLGDFDEQYGFLVDDRAGISYYYGQIPYYNEFGVDPGSERLHRNDYLRTVVRDPRWFAGIVRHRV